MFRLFFNHAMKRWHFPRLGWGCCGHKGHCKLRPDEVRVQSSVVGKDELDLIVQQLGINTPVPCIQALLLEHTDTVLTRGQIQGLNLSQRQLDSLRDVSVVGGASNTPAERLLQHLRSTEGVTFIACTGERDQSGLITFRQTRKVSKSLNVQKSKCLNVQISGSQYQEVVKISQQLVPFYCLQDPEPSALSDCCAGS